MIEEAILINLRHLEIEPLVHSFKYKLKFFKTIKDEETGEEDILQVCMRILKVNDNKCCVEFVRLGG